MRCSEPGQAVPSDPDLPGGDTVRLLGSVELVGPDGPVPLTDDAARLLGLLALRAGEVVAVADLRHAFAADRTLTGSLARAEALAPADDAGPASAGSAGAAVAALAAALAAAGLPDALQSRGDGLRLALAPERVDAWRFTGLVTEGRRRMAAGELAEAAELFATALHRWRVPVGRPPLSGSGPRPDGWAAAEANRLVEARLATIEARCHCLVRLAAAAYVATGGPTADRAVTVAGAEAARTAVAVAGELEEALRAAPRHPGLWELLLVATFLGAGRQAAARVADEARQRFTELVADEARQRFTEPVAGQDLDRDGDPAVDGWPAGPQDGVGRRLAELIRAARRGDLAEVWLANPNGVGPVPSAAPSAGAPAAAWPRPPRPAPPPVPVTPLLGREELLATVDARLAGGRLVTLTGPAGAGKTRLAIAVANRWRAGPVWFVDLAVVESPVQVPQAVAAALGVRDEAGRDGVDTLVDTLGDGVGLLLLDNCEYLVAGCAELVTRLLARHAGLRVLTTSRRALRAPGEVVVGVPSLAVPPPGAGHTVAELATHSASRLFLERARARCGRPVPDASAGPVAELCAELDGLPLAIELAAARTPMLDVGEIVTRIRADLRLLRNSDPTAPARHRTLTAALESSVEQLDPPARGLFERLAVFPGGVDVAAAQAMGGPDAAESLNALVDASLLEAAPATGADAAAGGVPARFRMLVPIRRHALARLAASGGEAAASRDFAAYCLDFAERAAGGLVGTGQESWLRRLRAEAPNLRAAMTWLTEAGAAAPRHGDLRMAVALARYHRLVGTYREGQSWLVAALARHPEAPAPLRAQGGTAAAMFALLLCEYPAAVEHAELARRACRAVGDRPGEARVETILGSIAREQARYAESAAHLAAASAIFVELGDEAGEAQTVQLQGFTAWLAGDLERATSRLRASLRWWQRLGDPLAGASALASLGAVALYRGDLAQAEALLATALRRCTESGYPEGVGWAHNLCGLVELRLGRTDRAADHLTRSLALHRQVGDRWRTASVLEALAEVARRQGEAWRAAGLLGAAGRIRAEIGAPVPACERADLAATSRALRADLDAEHGAGAFEKAFRYGHDAPLETMLALRGSDRDELVTTHMRG